MAVKVPIGPTTQAGIGLGVAQVVYGLVGLISGAHGDGPVTALITGSGTLLGVTASRAAQAVAILRHVADDIEMTEFKR